MSDIHIQRDHDLGLPHARSLAQAWANKIESKFDMTCRYAEGPAHDTLHFERAGVTGTMHVSPSAFEIRAELGFLFSAFKDTVASQIGEQLDRLLAQAGTPPAAHNAAS